MKKVLYVLFAILTILPAPAMNNQETVKELEEDIDFAICNVDSLETRQAFFGTLGLGALVYGSVAQLEKKHGHARNAFITSAISLPIAGFLEYQMNKEFAKIHYAERQLQKTRAIKKFTK